MRVALAFSCLLACGCGAVGEMRDKASHAETATIRLFAKIDESDVEGILLMFSSNLRLSHPLEKTRDVFEKIHREAGICDTPKMQSWNANVNADGTFVTLTAFARCDKRDLGGQLTWRMLGQQPVLERFSFASQLGNSSGPPKR